MEKNIVSSETIRKNIIKIAVESGEAAHIGGSLSMVELLNALYGEFLRHRPTEPDWEDRDIFILSKGHAVLGYFAVLNAYGYISDEKIKTFQKNGSDLIAHPIKNIPLGIESSNGSLGQGLSFGAGLAIGFQKKAQINRRVFVMLGDGECNEGSVWEAAAFAAEMKLSNICAIVDVNGFRNDGANTTNLNENGQRMPDKWRAFGWHVEEVDGHDMNSIADAFSKCLSNHERPSIIVANTIKGKGFEFMEANNDWHHNRITASIYEKCLEELNVNRVK